MFNLDLLLDPNNSDIMYVAGGRKLWRHTGLSSIPLTGSHDSLFTGWEYLPDTINNSSIKISAIAASVNPPNILWYGTSVRRLYKVIDAHTGSPQSIQMPLSSFPAGYISRIAVHPNNSDTVSVGWDSLHPKKKPKISIKQ